MTLFPTTPPPSPPGMPRLSTKDVLVPRQVLPSLRETYLKIARGVLRERGDLGAVELERETLKRLDGELGASK